MRIVGTPGPIEIELLPDESEATARQLIAHGGRCSSYEVLRAIAKILGDDTDGKGKGLAFVRRGKVVFDYEHFRAAIEENGEVRPTDREEDR